MFWLSWLRCAGGRGSAKTHLPTDEQTLKQLAALHPLPGLVLEHRCSLFDCAYMSEWHDSTSVYRCGMHTMSLRRLQAGLHGIHCKLRCDSQLVTALCIQAGVSSKVSSLMSAAA